jgi:hypothetical protein
MAVLSDGSTGSGSSSGASGGSGASGAALVAPALPGASAPVTRFAADRKPIMFAVAACRRRTAAPAAPAQPPAPLLAPRVQVAQALMAAEQSSFAVVQQIIDDDYRAHRQGQALLAATEAAEVAAAVLAAQQRETHRLFGAGPFDAALQLAAGDYDSGNSYYQASSAEVAELTDLRSSSMHCSGAELEAASEAAFE